MDRRAEVRLLAELSVDIAGIDTNGQPYRQTVSARSVSCSGGLLTGVRQQLRCGDLIAIQRDGLIARFRVVWLRDGQVAVQKLKHEPCLWLEVLENRASGSRLRAQGQEPRPPLL
jgi:hypothetical protein